ncbi:MAG: DUF5915 domain-containing protein [bacterium]
MGRALREQHRLKTRQPLRRVQVVHHDAAARAALETHADIIAEELNVKAVEVVADDAGLATLGFKADFKRLGRRLGKRMKEAADAIGALTRAEWDALAAGGSLTIADEPITAEDVIVTRTPRGMWSSRPRGRSPSPSTPSWTRASSPRASCARCRAASSASARTRAWT